MSLVWRRVAVICLLGGTFLVACGSGDTDEQVATEDDPLELVVGSAEETMGEEAFRFESRITMEGLDDLPGMDDPCYPDPVFDDEILVTGSSDGRTGTTEMSPPMDADIFSTMRFQGSTMYLSTDGAPEEWGVDTPWLRFEFPIEGSALVFGMFGSPNSPLDPTSMFTAIQDDATGVETLGREEIRGVPAMVYRVTLDEARFTARQRELYEQMAELYPEDVEELDPDETVEFLPVPTLDVAVDDEGRVRQIDSWYSADAMFSEQPDPSMPAVDFGEFHDVVDFFDFGETPALDVPPEDEVTDAAELGLELSDVDEATMEASDDDWEQQEQERLESLPPECEETWSAVGEAIPEETEPGYLDEEGNWIPEMVENTVIDDVALTCPVATRDAEEPLYYSDDPAFAACAPADVLQAITCVEDEAKAEGLPEASLLPREAFDLGTPMMDCVPEHLRDAMRCSGFIRAVPGDPVGCEAASD